MSPAWSQFILLGAVAVRMVLSVVVTVLLGRTLSAAEFGFFALVATVFGLSHELTDMGTGNVAVRVASAARDRERGMLETLLGLRLLLSLMAAAACIVLASLQPAASERVLLLATAAVLGCSFVSAYGMAFQLRQAQLPPAMLSVGVQVCALAAVAGLVALQVPGRLFATVLVAREAAVVAGVPILAARLLGYWPRPRFAREAMRPFFGRAVVVAAGTLFYHLQFQGGPFFVEWLRPAEELGAFAAGLRPLVPLLFIPWIIMLPLVPVLSFLASRDGPAFRRQAEGAVDLSIGLGAVVVAACLDLAPAALRFLYGHAFDTGPLSAVTTLRWLSLPLGLSFVTAAVSTILLADGRERLLLQVSAVGLAIYVAGNLWLLPRDGFAGSAVATAASIALVTAAGVLGLARGTGGYAPTWRTALIALPGLAVAALLQPVAGPPAWQLAVGVLLVGAAAAAVWWFPGLPAYRAEQAVVSRALLADA